MKYKLNENEEALLLKQNPSTKSDGGWQGLLVRLENKYNPNTKEITLSQGDIEKIQQYAFGYGNGGWESRLRGIFERHLGIDLSGN